MVKRFINKLRTQSVSPNALLSFGNFFFLPVRTDTIVPWVDTAVIAVDALRPICGLAEPGLVVPTKRAFDAGEVRLATPSLVCGLSAAPFPPAPETVVEKLVIDSGGGRDRCCCC